MLGRALCGRCPEHVSALVHGTPLDERSLAAFASEVGQNYSRRAAACPRTGTTASQVFVEKARDVVGLYISIRPITPSSVVLCEGSSPLRKQ